MPLCINPDNGEPYLQLAAPFSSIRITPPREADAPAATAIIQDPLVYTFLQGPPFPFTEQDALDYIRIIKPGCDKVFLEIKPYLDQGIADFFASGCPVRSIREVQADGTEIYIGDIGIDRSGYEELALSDANEQQRMADINETKPIGDPSIDWTIGGMSADIT